VRKTKKNVKKWKTCNKDIIRMLAIANDLSAGLPDGFFSNQKFQFGQILEGLRWENVDIFYGHLGYFTDIWDIL
jgi:hypothetical protein